MKKGCSEQQLTELVEQYANMVLRLATAALRNHTDAQDVCQEVFLKIYRKCPEFSSPEHQKAFMIRVTLNACHDFRRRLQRRPWVPLDDTMSLPIRESESRRLICYVLRLPARYRIVIHLYYYEGYPTPEIARILGKKEPTVRTQLKRAREQLQKMLEARTPAQTGHPGS